MANLLNRFQKPKKPLSEDDLLRERLEKLRQIHILSPPEPTPVERRRSTSVTTPSFITKALRSTSLGTSQPSNDASGDDLSYIDRRRSSSLSSSFLKNPFRSNSTASSLPSTADEDDDLMFPTDDKPQEEHIERRRGLSSSFLKTRFSGENDGNSSTALSSTIKMVSKKLSRAVSKSSEMPVESSGGRYVGEFVHTAAGAGIVTEVKADGSSVVRLCNNDIINCSSVIIEADGEIEPLPALPGDFVFTTMGPGTVLSYNPKLREFLVDIAEDVHMCTVDDIIASSDNKSDDTTDEEDEMATVYNNVSCMNLIISQQEAQPKPKSKKVVAMELARRAKKYLKSNSSRSKFHVGHAVFTTMGDGVIVEIRPEDQSFVIRFSAGGTGFLQEESIKCILKVKVGDEVTTRFGPGIVAQVAEENVFIVRVGHEDVYVHSSDLQLAKNKSIVRGKSMDAICMKDMKMAMIVLVTGGSGLVGRAVEEYVKNNKLNDETWYFTNSKEANLTDLEATKRLFLKYKPTHVLHLAAKVGGLFYNLHQPVDFYRENTLINDNVLLCAHESNVVKVVSCLSTCIFPNEITYPIDESMVHNGLPHTSNIGYAMAKRNLDILNQCYGRQYDRCFTSVIPTNVYGPHDNFNLEESHVIPGLIHKCYLAKRDQTPFVVSGTGSPLRQFIFSSDLAALMVWAIRSYDDRNPLILSVDESAEVSIKYVAETIASALKFTGPIVFDRSKSDGQYKKTASNAKMRSLSPSLATFNFTSFEDGITHTVGWFIQEFSSCRC
ncbi:hypothetical protein THRCLA_00470 [Thraustotheca clavata]|uniref:GDP-L-fucose synthase n=1 Tax=Thraustotheca clavata TaxID=74557 RepID=A0A1W0ABY2_9STRA|nr:hypothetical protein THRCLA_00470 [Thraustotheca clavata]